MCASADGAFLATISTDQTLKVSTPSLLVAPDQYAGGLPGCHIFFFFLLRAYGDDLQRHRSAVNCSNGAGTDTVAFAEFFCQRKNRRYW